VKKKNDKELVPLSRMGLDIDWGVFDTCQVMLGMWVRVMHGDNRRGERRRGKIQKNREKSKRNQNDQQLS